ncbi:MAG: VOC family protein [Pseudomonadota bacterium]
MTVAAQSDDYGTVTPYFTVDDPDALIAFAQTVFDAELIKINRYETGVVQHARLRIGDTMIMLNQSTEAFAAQVSQMHILVQDADQVFAHAVAAGAEGIMQPNLRPHGDRMAGVKDPCGNIWWIASRLP